MIQGTKKGDSMDEASPGDKCETSIEKITIPGEADGVTTRLESRRCSWRKSENARPEMSTLMTTKE